MRCIGVPNGTRGFQYVNLYSPRHHLRSQSAACVPQDAEARRVRLRSASFLVEGEAGWPEVDEVRVVAPSIEAQLSDSLTCPAEKESKFHDTGGQGKQRLPT